MHLICRGEKIKKTFNFILLGLICVILIWGAISSIIAYNQTWGTTKYTVSNSSSIKYNKDGKILVANDVNADEADLYIKSSKIEVIGEKEAMKRTVKYNKIIMNKMKNYYDKINADSSSTESAKFNAQLDYEEARTTYEQSKARLSNINKTAFQAGSGAFFGTYFPVVVLLGILLLLNKKLDKKEE